MFERALSERPLSELAGAIAAGAVRLTAATAAWLELVAEFDQRQGWAGYGIRSCAEWLAWQCGLSPGPAREHVRVARALRRLPVLSAAFAQGRPSYSKVRALTRVAEPATEAYLLEFALEATASQTERTVRQWRRADDDDSDGDSDSDSARQRIDWWWDEQGMLVLKTRLPAEAGAALIAAIDSLAERDARRERAAAKKTARQQADRADPADGDRRSSADEDGAVALSRELSTARRCAALSCLAEAAADRGRRPGDPPRRQVVVHLDAAVLAEDTAAGRAWIEGGPALSAAQARRLVCEGAVVAMLERGRQVLAVGRTRRLATRAQRLALLRRDGGCARPGCTEHRIERLHAHHLRHWVHGGRTDLANLVLLCDTCHGLAHDLDLTMTRRGGRLIVTTPDGRRVWGTPDAAFHHGTAGLAGLDAHGAAGLDPPAPTGGEERTGGETAPAFLGVHPIDTARGRRPDLPPADQPTATGNTTTGNTTTGNTATGNTTTGNTATGDGDGPATGCPGRPRLRRLPARPGDRRRPADHRPTDHRRPTDRRPTAARPTRTRPRPTPDTPTPRTAPTSISTLLFPGGEPPLPDAMHVNGERMDLRYVLSVLMAHRDAIRRWAAESGAPPEPDRPGTPVPR